jgi:hypothetical protein
MRPAWLCVGILLTMAPSAQAQESNPTVPPSPVQAAEPAPGEPARLYIGMWTTHLKHRPVTLENNWLIGFGYRGFFGATFTNSFGRRAYTAGVQRRLVSADLGLVSTSLGFRIGAVTGYDGRFMRLARRTPILPLISAYGNVDVGRVGVEVSYTMVVVSAAVSYRLGR